MNWISCIDTYIPSLLNLPPSLPSPPSHPSSHHRAPSWAPCAVQQVPTCYLFYIRQCAYIEPHLPFILPLLLPQEPVSKCLFPTSVSLFLPCTFSSPPPLIPFLLLLLFHCGNWEVKSRPSILKSAPYLGEPWTVFFLYFLPEFPKGLLFQLPMEITCWVMHLLSAFFSFPASYFHSYWSFFEWLPNSLIIIEFSPLPASEGTWKFISLVISPYV